MKTTVALSCFAILIIVMTTSVQAKKSCSFKTARTAQRSELERLSEDHIVVEAKYYNKYNENEDTVYRFATREVWPTYNGSLMIDEYIHVHLTDDQQIDCYSRLRFGRNYFLMLKRLDNTASSKEKHFQSLKAPVPVTIIKFRRTIYNSLCSSGGNPCTTRVILPKKKTLYNKQMKFIPCRVQTLLKEDDYKVEWVHEGKVVDSRPDAAVQTSRDEDGYLGLMILRGRVEDAGFYTCRVSTTGAAAAQTFEESMFVDVFDPHYEECPSSFCNNAGSCYKNLFGDQHFCHCNPGTTGQFCTDYGIPPTDKVFTNEPKIVARLRNLTVIVASFCVLVVVATVVATYHAHRLKNLIEKFMKTRRGVRKIVKKSIIASSTSSLPTPGTSNNPYTAVSVTPARSIE